MLAMYVSYGCLLWMLALDVSFGCLLGMFARDPMPGCGMQCKLNSLPPALKQINQRKCVRIAQ